MLDNKEMNKQTEKKLDQFITDLLVINGVSEYMGTDDETYNYIKQSLVQKLTPIIYDIVFKLPVSNI